jgi:hypothetical protein
MRASASSSREKSARFTGLDTEITSSPPLAREPCAERDIAESCPRILVAEPGQIQQHEGPAHAAPPRGGSRRSTLARRACNAGKSFRRSISARRRLGCGIARQSRYGNPRSRQARWTQVPWWVRENSTSLTTSRKRESEKCFSKRFGDASCAFVAQCTTSASWSSSWSRAVACSRSSPPTMSSRWPRSTERISPSFDVFILVQALLETALARRGAVWANGCDTRGVRPPVGSQVASFSGWIAVSSLRASMSPLDLLGASQFLLARALREIAIGLDSQPKQVGLPPPPER